MNILPSLRKRFDELTQKATPYVQPAMRTAASLAAPVMPALGFAAAPPQLQRQAIQVAQGLPRVATGFAKTSGLTDFFGGGKDVLVGGAKQLYGFGTNNRRLFDEGTRQNFSGANRAFGVQERPDGSIQALGFNARPGQIKFTGENIVGSGAPRVALTAAGTLFPGAKSAALLTGGLTSGINYLTGQDPYTGFGEGASRGLQINTVAGLTNPLLGKFLPRAAPTMPTWGKLAINRLIPATANVGQGMVIDKATGMPTTLTSMGIDFGVGLVLGRGQFDPRVAKFTDDQLAKGKNIAQRIYDQIGDAREANRRAYFEITGKELPNGADPGFLAFRGSGGGSPFAKVASENDSLGKGTYATTDRSFAKTFGKVDEVDMNGANPLVIRNKADLDALGLEMAQGQYKNVQDYMNAKGFDLYKDEVTGEVFKPAKALENNPQAGFINFDELNPFKKVDNDLVQCVPRSDLKAYEDAFNGGDTTAMKKLADQFPDDTRFHIHEKVSGKLRGFPKTVEGTLGTPEEVAGAVKRAPENFYTPLSNKEVVNKATQLIKKSEVDALNFARTGKDTDANATAMLLIDKYIKNQEFDKANELIKQVSPRFTEQGQQIQILSLYGRLTPSGALKFAQKIIDDANAQLPKTKQLSLSKEAMKQITDQAEIIQKMPEGREKSLAIAKLMDTFAAQVPSSLAQKVSTIQTMAQLMNPVTAIRNTVGNTGFAAIENVKDTVATAYDRALSLITGQRTKSLPDIGAQVGGLKRGWKEGVEDALQGVETNKGVASQFDLPNRTFRDPVFGRLEKVMNIELRATDRAAYTAAFEGSLSDQMRAAKVSDPTDAMIEQAHLDGLYRTFQDNSTLAKIFSGTKKGLNRYLPIIKSRDGLNNFGMGDLILKYPKTPANILQRGIDYSPIGLVGSLIKGAKQAADGAFNQREFVEAASRGTVGTGIVTLGYFMSKLGLVTGDKPNDYDVSATQESTGKRGYSVNATALKRFVMSGLDPSKAKTQPGDQLVSFDWFQPQSIPFSIGVNAAQNAGKEGQLDNLATTAFDALNSGVNTLAEQPLVTGISRFARDFVGQVGGQRDFVKPFVNALVDMPASFVPSIVNRASQLTDATARSTYNTDPFKESYNKVAARLPFLRKSLQPRVDVFGNDVQFYKPSENAMEFLGNTVNTLFNPAILSKVKSNPSAEEVLRIFSDSGETQQAPRVVKNKVEINGEQMQLSPQQVTDYQRYVGVRTQVLFDSLIQNQQFGQLTDEEKAKAMSNLLTDINTAAKIELFGHQPKTQSRRSKAVQALDFSSVKQNPVSDDKIIDSALGNSKVFDEPKAPKIPKVKKTKAPKQKSVKVKKLSMKVPKAPKVRIKKTRKRSARLKKIAFKKPKFSRVA